MKSFLYALENAWPLIAFAAIVFAVLFYLVVYMLAQDGDE